MATRARTCWRRSPPPAGVATLVQASTGFAISQILGVAAQKAITDLRKSVHDHVLQLPTAYFDSVKSGELISRIMTDAQGIRNLVGTGLVQLFGRAPYGNDCTIGALLLELAPHLAHARRALVIRGHDGVRLYSPPATFPQARRAERDRHRTPRRSLISALVGAKLLLLIVDWQSLKRSAVEGKKRACPQCACLRTEARRSLSVTRGRHCRFHPMLGPHIGGTVILVARVAVADAEII